MKIGRRNLIALPIVWILLAFAPVYSAAGDNKPALSKQELKALLTSATRPAEHRKIAEYYQQEAQRLTDSSKEHAELAEVYEKGQAIESSGTLKTGMATSHCQRFAQWEADAAKEAQALAALHEKTAKAMEQK